MEHETAAAAAAVEKPKQQKMPKARANIYVYSSTRFFGLIFEGEKTVPGSSDLRRRDYQTYAQHSYSYQVPQLRHPPRAHISRARLTAVVSLAACLSGTRFAYL